MANGILSEAKFNMLDKKAYLLNLMRRCSKMLLLNNGTL